MKHRAGFAELSLCISHAHSASYRIGRERLCEIQNAECAACGHDRLVPEDGPTLCDDCRFDAGDIVRNRETGDRVVVVETTVADYETNPGYPGEDSVVVVVYPYSGDQRFSDLNRYAFSHSQLEATDGAYVV